MSDGTEGRTQDAVPVSDDSGLAFESVARLMTRNILIVDPDATIAETRNLMAERRFDTLSDIAVCEGPSLRGLVRLEDLMASPGHRPVSAVMDNDPPVAAPGVDQEIAIWKAVSHGESALAVVDDAGIFLGLIPPERMLGVVLAEHDEDLARLGGFLRGSAGARRASLEPIYKRLWHRLPWLLVGLMGAVAAAIIVDGFESKLREVVLLAFFLPGVVYLADAVGTQTEALIIRGLSVGVSVRQVVARELITGLVAGLALGAAFLPIGLVGWHDADVALTVSISMFLACTTATVVAMLLPWLFSAAGHDPAFGSGPLATVVQDLLSIVLYFTVAWALI